MGLCINRDGLTLAIQGKIFGAFVYNPNDHTIKEVIAPGTYTEFGCYDDEGHFLEKRINEENRATCMYKDGKLGAFVYNSEKQTIKELLKPGEYTNFGFYNPKGHWIQELNEDAPTVVWKGQYVGLVLYDKDKQEVKMICEPYYDAGSQDAIIIPVQETDRTYRIAEYENGMLSLLSYRLDTKETRTAKVCRHNGIEVPR